jgi:cytidine deaminase
MNNPLLDHALRARDRAIAPFSHFQVGAALEAKDGRIYTGCNIENASYGLTVCAERVALLKALSEGARNFNRMALVTDGSEPTYPCGACRQLLWEFCGDIEVNIHSTTGLHERIQLAELLPHPFDRRLLKEKG